jgi:hypothetical protein
MEMLRMTRHQAFPVVAFDAAPKTDHSLATLHGIILRHQILMLLQFGAYGRRGAQHPRMTLADFRKGYPRFVSACLLHSFSCCAVSFAWFACVSTAFSSSHDVSFSGLPPASLSALESTAGHCGVDLDFGSP